MTAAKIEPWLAEKITRNRRRATPKTCRRCGTPTLTGDDHDTVAIPATVDQTPATWLEEVVAHLTGRPTYEFTGGALHYREPWHLARPARGTTHLEHRCPK